MLVMSIAVYCVLVLQLEVRNAYTSWARDGLGVGWGGGGGGVIRQTARQGDACSACHRQAILNLRLQIQHACTFWGSGALREWGEGGSCNYGRKCKIGQVARTVLLVMGISYKLVHVFKLLAYTSWGRGRGEAGTGEGVAGVGVGGWWGLQSNCKVDQVAHVLLTKSFTHGAMTVFNCTSAIPIQFAYKYAVFAFASKYYHEYYDILCEAACPRSMTTGPPCWKMYLKKKKN